MRTLLVSAIITPDGTRLESAHRHDYNAHTDANGEMYVIDGGLDYIRTSVNKVPAVNACVYSDDPHEVIRESFKWGTYGKNGDEPLQRKTLDSLDTSHIVAILDTQHQLKAHIRKVFEDELVYRGTLL